MINYINLSSIPMLIPSPQEAFVSRQLDKPHVTGCIPAYPVWVNNGLQAKGFRHVISMLRKETNGSLLCVAATFSPSKVGSYPFAG